MAKMTLKRLQLIEMPMLCRRRNGSVACAYIRIYSRESIQCASNKVIRQASFIAAALAQFVSEKRNGMCLIMVICPVLLNCWVGVCC